ncbi:MAG: NAD-dependent epimerase/dehydratase family protein [Deltaproteobacteria bacterium]|nr:NAD-dependent epimerase/dehydratase family protein [Deltaproteobacteria bacterium]
MRDREWVHEVEVIGTLNVLNACADAGVRKVIITSTTAVYGAYYKNPALIPETFPLSPQYASPWVKDKIEAESEIKKFREKKPEMIISVLRLCFVLGKKVNNFFIRSLLRPVVPVVMGYDPCLQFLHEDDAIEAFMLAIEKDYSGEINVASADSVPLSTVIGTGDRKPLPLPHFILYPLYEFLWGINIIDTPASSLNFMRFPFSADTSLAGRVLGFRAKYSSLESVRIFYEFHR